MPDFNDFTPVKKALATARSVPVILPQQPNKDKVAAALGLFLSLNKMGKEALVVCAEKMTVELSWLVGIDKIGQKMAGENLLISFDYIEDSIEKVSYNIEEGRFNLVIQPKEGGSPLSTDKITYSHSGSRADLLFTIGSSSLDNLGEVYRENKALFKKDKVINIDNSSNNAHFGKFNLVNPRAFSCSELVVGLLSRVGLPVDVDIASNLFYGLEKATRNFSLPRIGPEVFEAAAFCLRAGARRQERISFLRKTSKKPSLEPMPRAISASRPPDLVEKSQPKDIGERLRKQPLPDWFEPKVYQGGTRL